MHSHGAFGLKISSAIELPELQAHADAQADVTVRRATIDVPDQQPAGAVVESADVYRMWSLVGALLVRQGNEIVVDQAAGISDALMRMLIVGRGLGALLNQRGRLVLHASTVRVQGTAVLFLGHSGAGKSTAAAAMYQAGSAVVAEDFVPVDEGELTVHPGFPQLKLDGGAAVTLGVASQARPRLHPQVAERYYDAPAGFSEQPLKISRVYVIERGQAHAVRRLPSPQACIELVRFTYGAALLVNNEARKRHFSSCARLAREIGVHQLTVPSTLTALQDWPDRIAEDVRTSMRR